ncbi:MAG: ribosome maturation factor RimP [Alphaproteobacteria bacterium]|nr:ribosome maturation factor RimP [Alphaproteobacteria bacterium]
MIEAARIQELIAPTLESMGFALVRVRFTGGNRTPTLQVMVERRESMEQGRPDDGGVSADDCAEISRTVSAFLDVEDPIPGTYHLEVSSPGIDRPLTRPGDFVRFSGFAARIELREPLDGRRRFAGRLLGASATVVQFADEQVGTVEVPIAAIHSAKLRLTDELIAASLKARPTLQPKEREP